MPSIILAAHGGTTTRFRQGAGRGFPCSGPVETVTFPAGRFASPPVVEIDTTLPAGVGWVEVNTLSSTGFTWRMAYMAAPPPGDLDVRWKAKCVTEVG